jgi:diguanylate cyclase
LTAIHGGPVPMATLQSVTELVAGMLERIDIAAERRPQMVGLRDRVLRVTTSVDLAGVLRETADLVNRQRVQLQNEKAEIERLLQQVTTRLDEIANYLTRETEDQQAARASSVTLNDAMLSEVRSLDARVQQATDLATLQRQVRNQLDAISRHLHDFLSREHSRQDAYRDRSEQLRRRIDELEQETRSLNLSLQEKHRQATTDALTGIPNRLAYEQRIDLEYLRWKRAPSPLCIAAWDIDRFKAINDTYGHTGGDKVLSVVGQFFVKNLRRTDFIARYGGEEFTMILVGAAAADALRLTEGLRLSIQNLGFHYHGKPVQITVSCGVAEFRTGDLPEDVFQRADKALYKAKEQGRNCCVAG